MTRLRARVNRFCVRIRANAAVALLGACAALSAVGCANDAPTDHGQVQGQPYAKGEWLQSDGNRITQIAMRANEASLLLLADKLYRRNPKEWRKTASTRDAALAQIAAIVRGSQPWSGLNGQRDVAALSLALSPDFSGDRVAAFIIACDDTIVAAHGGKHDFYYLDGIDPQHVYNAARDMEIALWLLTTRRNTQGRPLLLANEIGPQERNLSFEREFGKIIGRLDLLASYMVERYRRAGIDYVQGLVMAPFLAFVPVK
jgi:hypothetical protein